MLAYRLKADNRIEPAAAAGTVVYPLKGYDYGLASDDTDATGIPHRSVTLDRAGGYPSFTAPEPDLEPIQVEDFQPLTTEHIDLVCQPGTERCCRYLTMGPRGWGCEKLTSLRLALDMRVDAGSMRAIGDNCDGRTTGGA